MTSDGVRLASHLLDGRSSIDIRLDGERVWSVDLLSASHRPGEMLPWPQALAPYLDGTAALTVTDSVSGEEIAASPIHLGSRTTPITVTDALGRRLSVNKWGRMGKTFDGANQELRHRILDHLDALVAFCQERDLRPFVVGGTLLGAVRDGAILGHDDDADLAYLSEHTHPSDLALESFRIERDLRDLGYDVVRHSAAHLQLTFRTETGAVESYLDLFTAFFREDGTINQPFHVRGPFPAASMLPMSEVTLEGRTYPAPAVVEDWLELNYDENWRVPLPGYRLRTPHSTRRRFRSWFGTFHFLRDFWEAHHEMADGDPASGPASDLRGAHRLIAQLPVGSRVMDLGCGGGEAALVMAEQGLEVIGVDFSARALHRAAALATAAGVEVETWCLNLNDLRDVARAIERIGEHPDPLHLHLGHLLERMGDVGRKTLLGLLRQSARTGGRITVLVDTLPAPEVTFHDPTTWHLTMTDLKAELARFGLGVVNQELLQESERDRERRTLLLDVGLLARHPEGSPS